MWAPRLAELGVRDMQTFKAIAPEQTVDVARNFPDLEKLCNLLDRPIPSKTSVRSHRGRPDLPIVNSSAGAITAAPPDLRVESLQNLDRDQVCQQHKGHPGPTLGSYSAIGASLKAVDIGPRHRSSAWHANNISCSTRYPSK